MKVELQPGETKIDNWSILCQSPGGATGKAIGGGSENILTDINGGQSFGVVD